MRAFLSERYLSYNLSSKMTISHSRLAGTKIFQTLNMPEIFEMSYLLTQKSALNPNRKKVLMKIYIGGDRFSVFRFFFFRVRISLFFFSVSQR